MNRLRLIRERLAGLAGRLTGGAARTLARRFGDRGERLAARHLRRAGLKIIARGWQGRSGEIDLIAREGATVVFVEVKTRRGTYGGRPEHAVDARKRRAILRLANEWAADYARRGGDRAALAIRFDIVAILWPDGGEPEIRHIRGAFDAGGVR